MFHTSVNKGYVHINYHSDLEFVRAMNESVTDSVEVQRIFHKEFFGGYTYPILDWISEELGGSRYQILKCSRPENTEQFSQLHAVLKDPNTLYGYPDGHKITIVQFEGWDNTQSSLADLGICVTTDPKMFKRLKTLNRPFRSFAKRNGPVRVLLVDDCAYCAYADFIEPDDREKLLDGAFILSPATVNECMKVFDEGTIVFDEDSIFSCGTFNRNTEIGDFYRRSPVFNARIFGDIETINDGDYSDYVGAIKGQAFVDRSGVCEYYGVDVIAPYSAFKREVNFTGVSFFLIEPQSAKLGQMFSDGQTISNMPALYRWRSVRDHLDIYYDDMFDKLVSNQVLDQWSDMSFAMFRPENPKMFDETDVVSLTMWNVRAWLMCGGDITASPWLFEQMGRNLLASMRITDDRKFRFPVPCAARAQVISESLFRAVKGISPTENFFRVDLGTARWDRDMNVLVVNDLDWIEMYPSHGGCDLDDFFQIYWRTMDGVRKIVICRSPNDWGEYSIFDYVEGDWFSRTSHCGEQIEFPEIPSNPRLWAKRLSHALVEGDIEYRGLPSNTAEFHGDHFDAEYIMAAIHASSSAPQSVGVNVNARQLWSSSALSHRPKQLCSMEDCIDAGVQGGTDEQVEAVLEEGHTIVDLLIANDYPIETYLWISKHAHFYPNVEPRLENGNMTYLQAVRVQKGKAFLERYSEFAESIPERNDYRKVHALGRQYLEEGLAMLRAHRRNVAIANQNGGIDAGHWDALNDILVIKIEGAAPGHERNSLVLGLYSACLKMPTASGKITDQPVMQPSVFPHLLEALQFYGLLGCLVVDDQNQIHRTYNGPWNVTDSNGKFVTI
ncbi:MAG: hypothetical protein ACWGQW_06865, partial [bacterium]